MLALISSVSLPIMVSDFSLDPLISDFTTWHVTVVEDKPNERMNNNCLI